MASSSTTLTRERLKATDHGRSEGWDLELEGRIVAHLDEPRFEDMFWISYRITPRTDDAELAARLLTEEFWRGDAWRGLTFRSRALGVAARPFPSIDPLVEPARVNMRKLYVTHPDDERAWAKRREAGLTGATTDAPGLFGRLWRRLLGRPR